MSKLRVDQLEPLDQSVVVDVADLIVDLNDADVTTSTGTQPLPEALDARGLVFPTVSDMASSATLVEGLTCITLGYQSLGDGGGTRYEIVASGTGTADGGSFIDLPGSGLQAQAVFSGSPRLSQFGAQVGSDSSDAWDALCRYSQSSGTSAVVDGPFSIATAYTLSATGDLKVEGAGPGCSLEVSDASGMFTGTTDGTIVVENLLVLSGSATAGVMDISRAEGGTAQFILKSVTIRSQTGLPFASGITLNNVGNIYLHQVDAFMADTDKTQCTHFLDISGSGPEFVTNFVMSDSKVFMCETGIKVSSSDTIATSGFEGFKIIGSDIVAVKTALLVDHYASEPDYMIQGCHLNFDDAGIYGTGVAQARIRNNLIYCQSTNEDAVFIYLEAPRGSGSYAELIDISGNQMTDVDVEISAKPITSTGVWLVNTQFFHVTDNQIKNCANGLLVGGASKWGRISQNMFINGSSSDVMLVLQTGVTETSSYSNTHINVPNRELNQGGATNIIDGESSSLSSSGSRIESQSVVVTSDGAGAVTQGFQHPFPGKPVVTATLSDVATGGVTISVDDANTNGSSFRLTTHPALASTTFRLNYTAFYRS